MYQVTKVQRTEQALTNKVYTSVVEFGSEVVSVMVKERVYLFRHQYDTKISELSIGFSGVQRQSLSLALGDRVDVNIFREPVSKCKSLQIQLEPVTRKKSPIYFSEKDVFNMIPENIPLQVGGVYLLNNDLTFRVIDIDAVKNTRMICRFFDRKTSVLEPIISEDVMIISKKSKISKKFFSDDFDFTTLGLGGMNKEMISIFRRAFASWAIDPDIIQKMGIKHERGILLYGPPGCGKTAFARAVSKLLTNNIKLVNGPELMNKFVGGSEEKIRELFEPAIQSYKSGKDELFVIILDEFDALVPTRGTRSGSTGVHDSMVTQFLTMIEGVDTPNNFIIIALTNRKDQIDEAILRDGRIGIHVHIGLPDLHGREQIFRIHTQKLRDGQMFSSDIDLSRLAELSRNFSGSEIEASIRAAGSFAISRVVKNEVEDIPMITMDDCISGIKEITPLYGKTSIVEIYKTSPEFDNIISGEYVKNLKSIIIYGDNGAGKTSVACSALKMKQFIHTNYLESKELLQFTELVRSRHLMAQIYKASESESSCLVLDDIDIMLEYSGLGGVIRFSNIMYQTLKSILKSRYSSRITLIVTTSDLYLYDYLSPSFDHSLSL